MHRKFTAIKLEQPFGDFFCVSMKAIDLLELTFSDTMRYEEDGNLRGSQRKLDEKQRLSTIKDYINSQELTFPNSIVIAANYNENGNIEEDENLRWDFTPIEGGLYEIVIPTNIPLASIIDGQHRVKAFEHASDNRKENTDLLVSIYFDLPIAYQAYIFASINYNQKPVSKSLALEQFGYLLETHDPKTWSPELLSIFLTRKLNKDNSSIFYNHIKVAPQNDQYLLTENQKDLPWIISTSTCVTGILNLLSRNPKKDSNKLNEYSLTERNRKILEPVVDKSILRPFYITSNDLFVYTTINNFFSAVDVLLFSVADKNSFITKTIGISALFRILKSLLEQTLHIDKDISIEYFKNKLLPAKKLDFSNSYFKSPSGSGINRIYNAIAISLNLKTINEIRNEDDRQKIAKILEDSNQ